MNGKPRICFPSLFIIIIPKLLLLLLLVALSFSSSNTSILVDGLCIAGVLGNCDDKSPSDKIQDAISGCPLRCGRGIGVTVAKEEEKHFRVLGGETIDERNWPWLFKLQTIDSACDNSAFTCTATLISSKFLLTAAHCVFKNIYSCKKHPSGKDKTNYVPYLTHEISVIRRGESYPVKDFTVMEDFEENSVPRERFVGDLAIVELETEVDYEPLCMTKTYKRENERQDWLVGYGAHGEDSNGNLLSDGLRYTKVNLASVENCRSTWSWRASLCAGSDGKGALNGDSGANLMTKHLGLYFGIGILSSHWPGNDRANRPDIYVPLSKYCTKIEAKTGIACVDNYAIPVECIVANIRADEELF